MDATSHPYAAHLTRLRERICSTLAQLGNCVTAIEDCEAELGVPDRGLPVNPALLDEHLDEMGCAVDVAGEHLTSVSDGIDALQKAIAAGRGGTS